MQTDVERKIGSRTESPDGFAAIVPTDDAAAYAAPIQPFARFLASLNPIFPGFLHLSQTQGWAMKAHEFIDSGPPVLLNNPCCCRRVVCSSFLKHAMEVHYG
jgi:hypothetical protein